MALQKDALRRMFEEVSLGAPENAIGFILWRITSRYQREMDRALVAVDLSHLQFVTLALVGWFERSGTVATQIELSRFGGIHPMQLSQMLKTLEAKQFIVRRRDTADSRAKQVALTRKGFGTLRKALPQAIKVQSRLFGETGAKGSVLLKELLQLDFHLSTTIGREPETPSVIRQHKS